MKLLSERIRERLKHCKTCGGTGVYVMDSIDMACMHCADWITTLKEVERMESTDADPETTLTVQVGHDAQDYSIGDFLNAIDAVVCYFQAMREQTDTQLAAALKMYAEEVEVNAQVERP